MGDLVTASVLIDADPADVFEYFTRPEAMLEWMGQRAQLDARPGGEFAVDIDGSRVRGHYVELDPPHRLVLTWGFAGSAVLPPGASTVEVRLIPEQGATRVQIAHRGLSGPMATEHVSGWRRFTDRLATTASRSAHS